MPQRNYAAITILLLIYLLPVSTPSVAASTASSWWTHLVYPFFHANIFHLLANIYALWFIRPTYPILLTAWAIAIASSWITPVPVVGFSSIIYAIWGMNMLNASQKAWIIFSAINLITIFLPDMGWMVHFSAFTIGLLYSYFKRLSNEYRRACKRR